MKGIFLDIETTGLDFHIHRPIDLALKIIDLGKGEVLDEYQKLIAYPYQIWEKRDLSSIEMNGYTWEEIRAGIIPDIVREELIRLFTKQEIIRGKAVFICQNPSFDRSFFSHIVPVYTQEGLNWPYHWLDLASMYWVRLVDQFKRDYPQQMNLSKNQIAESFQILPEDKPHKAMNGVNHLIKCYQAVLNLNWR